MRALLVVAALGCVAVGAAQGHPFIGSRRNAASHRGRVLRHLEQADPVLPFEKDSFAFTGPVHGLGYVNHTHNVVFRNDSLSLDLWTEVLHKASCVALPDTNVGCQRYLARRAGLQSQEDDITDNLMGGGKCRPGVTLRLEGLRSVSPTTLKLFRRHLALSRVIVVGIDAMEALPPGPERQACRAALLHGGTSPTFSISSVTSFGDDGSGNIDGLSLTLPRAGLMDAFAAASWYHKIEQDIPAALERRGLSPPSRSDMATDLEATSRRLAKFNVLAMGWNWQGLNDAQVDLPVVESIPLKTFFNGSLALSCEDCYARVLADVEVKLGFCGRVKVLWFSEYLDFGCEGDDRDHDVSLHVFVKLDVNPKASFNLRFGTWNKDGGKDWTIDAHTGRQRIGKLIDGPEYTFFIWGLPIKIKTGIALEYRLGIEGTLQAALRTGVTAQGKFSAQYKFNSRALDNGWTHSWEHSVDKTPLTFEIKKASATAYLEVLPTFVANLYGVFPVNVSRATRVQADLDRMSDDAVLCDVPYCGEGVAGLPLYITYQHRLVISNGDLRVRDIVGTIPLLGKLAAKLFKEDSRFIKEGEPINKPLTPRKKLYGTCVDVERLWALATKLFWSSKVLSMLQTDFSALVKRQLPEIPAPKITVLSKGESDANVGDGRRLQVTATPTRSPSFTETATRSPAPSTSASITGSATGTMSTTVTPSSSPAYGTLVIPDTITAISTAGAADRYTIEPGQFITRAFFVPDSTVPVFFAFRDDGRCCSWNLFGWCTLGYRHFQLTVQFRVGGPTSRTISYGETLYATDARKVYEISATSAYATVYNDKQAQGFGRSGSWYYVTMANDAGSCLPATGELFVQYQTLPSPTPSPSVSISLTSSNTPTPSQTPSNSASGTATMTSTASETASGSKTAAATGTPTNSRTGTATVSSSVAPSTSSTATASLSSGVSASKTASETASKTASASLSLSSTETASYTSSVSISYSQTTTRTETRTGSISFSASISFSSSATATPTASVSGSSTQTAAPTVSTSFSPSAAATTSPTTPPFKIACNPNAIVIVDGKGQAANGQKMCVITSLAAKMKTQVAIAASTELQKLADKLPEALKGAAAVLLGAEPSEIGTTLVGKTALGGGSKRRLGDAMLVDLEYSVQATRNITLEGSDPSVSDDAGAQDLDDAQYFMDLAANSSAALIKGAVDGTLPANMWPQVDCSDVKDAKLLELFCGSQSKTGGRRAQSGMTTLSFATLFAAGLTQQGVSVAAAAQAASVAAFVVTKEPVVQTATVPVALVGANGSVVRQIAPDKSAPPAAAESDSGLSGGAIAGIIIGAFALVALAGVGIALAVRQQQRSQQRKQQQQRRVTTVHNPVTVRGRQSIAGSSPASPASTMASPVPRPPAQPKRVSVAANARATGRGRLSAMAKQQGNSRRGSVLEAVISSSARALSTDAASTSAAVVELPTAQIRSPSRSSRIMSMNGSARASSAIDIVISSPTPLLAPEAEPADDIPASSEAVIEERKLTHVQHVDPAYTSETPLVPMVTGANGQGPQGRSSMVAMQVRR